MEEGKKDSGNNYPTIIVPIFFYFACFALFRLALLEKKKQKVAAAWGRGGETRGH